MPTTDDDGDAYQERSAEAFATTRELRQATYEGILALMADGKQRRCEQIELFFVRTLQMKPIKAHQRCSAELRHMCERRQIEKNGRSGTNQSGKRADYYIHPNFATQETRLAAVYARIRFRSNIRLKHFGITKSELANDTGIKIVQRCINMLVRQGRVKPLRDSNGAKATKLINGIQETLWILT